MPSDELIDRCRQARLQLSAAVEQLVPVLEEIAIATVRDVLPDAHRLEVLGEMNEDWARTLRIQRVLDVDGRVLFDHLVSGADDDLEDLIHEVGIEYLDLLLEVTGEDDFGTKEIEA